MKGRGSIARLVIEFPLDEQYWFEGDEETPADTDTDVVESIAEACLEYIVDPTLVEARISYPDFVGTLV